ncbi:hypothetical protein PR048_008371 [Dryococelus australis]|uniref:Uncharacterized protein n=1 Tax=Dryococelus australis TaxID=614101 RepID=A0ABQ9HX83_9NEOP|nr:hypothetical protein PR048_008371 [Dryococelus australis]
MEEEEKVKAIFKDQSVVVLCDETTNTKGECVFVILFKIVFGNSDPKLVAASVKVLNSTNAIVCSRAVVETATKYDIKHDNVCVHSFPTRLDTRTNLLVLVCNNLLYAQYWAYKLHVVGNVRCSELTALNECEVKGKMAFLNTRKRKHHHLEFLNNTSLKPKSFPSPVLTRWNAWLKSVEYLDKYMNIIAEFFKQYNGEGSDATQYLQNFFTVQGQTCGQAVGEGGIVNLFGCLEDSSYPLAHELHAKLADLKNGYKFVSDHSFTD